MAMIPGGQEICCASIPAKDLPVLADVRGLPGIRVSIFGDEAWICWDRESDSTRQVMIQRLLPLSGVAMYARRGGYWYRPNEFLPAFHVPVGDGLGGMPLERVIFPKPMKVRFPRDNPPERIKLRLVRDGRGQPMAATAVCCRIERLSEWAERETSLRIESLMGSWFRSNTPDPKSAEVLLLGHARSLPISVGGVRFWGSSVLIPLGFRADPELSESALRQLVGAEPGEVVILDGQGFERIAISAFQPLSRASIRMALSLTSSGHVQGGQEP